MEDHRSRRKLDPDTQPVLRSLGLRIRALRLQAGRTQEEFAGAVDIDYKRFQRLEAGSVNPTINTLVRIAKGLDVEVAALFTDEVN